MFIFILTALASCFAFASPNQEYMFLKDRRAEFRDVMPVYTPQEKQLVADQAVLVLRDMYVHHNLKNTLFHENPVAKLEALQKKASSLSDYALHSELSQLFTRQRDFHTQYYLPYPFSCYTTLIPFVFDRVWDSATKKHVLVITHISNNSVIYDMIPVLNDIQVGDIVETYNGMDPLTAIRQILPIDSGANAAAQVRAGMDILTVRFHNLRLDDPVEDAVELKLRKKSGAVRTVSIPWLSKAGQACLRQPLAAESSAEPIEHATNKRRVEMQKLFPAPRRVTAEISPSWLAKRSLPAPDAQADLSNLIDTDESTIKYKVLHNVNGTFGYLLISNFDTYNLSNEDAAKRIRELLAGPLSRTDGLILDVRGNPGGQIAYAEGLLQLFGSANIEVEGFRFRTTATNRKYIVGAGDSIKLAAWTAAAKAGQLMSAPLAITPSENANSVGQFYFKPTLVLTDAYCYSACEIFTAGMQDNGLARIWGVDARTGGGGASVQTLTGVFGDLPAGQTAPFEALPRRQDMDFAWRQAVRVGKNKGKLIEDFGIQPDWYSTPSLADLALNDQILLKRLTQKLLEMNSAVNQASATVIGAETQDFLIGQNMVFGVRATATARIEVKAPGQLLLSQNVNPSPVPTDVQIAIPSHLQNSLAKAGWLELIGFNEKGVRLWRKTLNYRLTPAESVAPPIKFDFSQETPAPDLFLYPTVAVNGGWTVQNGNLRVGREALYPNSDHAVAAIFVDLTYSPAAQLNFAAEVHTEKDHDFFRVLVVAPGQTYELLKLSGEVGSKTYNIDLRGLAGQKVEVRFVFDSDPNLHYAGPLLHWVTIE